MYGQITKILMIEMDESLQDLTFDLTFARIDQFSYERIDHIDCLSIGRASRLNVMQGFRIFLLESDLRSIRKQFRLDVVFDRDVVFHFRQIPLSFDHVVEFQTDIDKRLKPKQKIAMKYLTGPFNFLPRIRLEISSID